MVFCEQCGREIAMTARFCGSCGASALAAGVPPTLAAPDVTIAGVGARRPGAGSSVVAPRTTSVPVPEPTNGSPAPSERSTDARSYLKWAYVAGIVLIGVGIRVAFFITRYTTNLLTGHVSTSFPDMGIGVVLVVIGAVLMGGAWLASNGRVRR